MVQIVLMVVIAVCVLFGVLIFLNNPRNPMNLLAAGINISLSIGILSYVLLLGAETSESASLYIKAGYAAAMIVAALMTIFVFIFPKGERLPRFVSLVILLSSAVLIGLLFLLPGFMIENAVVNVNGNFCSVVDSPSYIMYCLYLAFFFSFAIVALVRKIILFDKKYRIQLSVYLFGMMIIAIPSLITNIVMPYFQDCQFLWVGSLTTSIFVIIVSYNIIRHGLFDIRWTAVRTLAYILSLTFLAVIYFLVANLISNLFFNNNFSLTQNPFSIGLALGSLFIFQPIKNFFDRLTNRIFYRNDYDRDEFFTRLNRLLTSTTYLRHLLEQTSNEIASTFKSNQVSFYIYTRNGGHISAGTEDYYKMSQKDIDYVQSVTGKKAKIVIASLLDDEDSLKIFMSKHQIELIITLAQDNVMGYLLLGGHQASNHYNQRDINVLTEVADELVIAIQNKLSIQEIRDINAESLQQRIDSATNELRLNNESLRKMDEEKNEFVSVVSHELRTPLSVINGYIDLLKRGRLGALNKEQHKVLTKMDKSDKTLINIVNDMLDLSKIEANEFDVKLSSNSLDELIYNSLEEMQMLYKDKGISLSCSGIRVRVNTNPSRFGHVMLNLLNNAYKFTPAGGSVKVTTTVNSNALMATICVTDTGIGISEADIDGIFKKFSQVDGYLQRQTGGTGLGLSISKAIIEKMGGKIWVESKIGVGSKFYFTVPLAPDAIVDQSRRFSSKG